ncbi:hypothetical protein G7047_04205 [Diaphorobacter sp. HDW4A]|uniref:hypothetical protein n=1 Tax=Diaphorobacter sp. HDW4A TaxID=2714924 RepID=UPI00140B3BFF|nr:hypothetical protein [Diaphorobacter sp. HDW4A]QIL79200.1 hypothetical protein G7047_04205 [Diaphorobacter sp. HDW4A]
MGARISLPRTTIAALSICALAPLSNAFELHPKPLSTEVKLAKLNGISFRAIYPAIEFGVHAFADSTHEALTRMAYECPMGNLIDCQDEAFDVAPLGVIAGVRWNDDPPFQFAKGQGNYAACKDLIDKRAQEHKDPPTISFSLSVICWRNHFNAISKESMATGAVFNASNATLLARSHFGDLQFLHAMASRSQESPEETQEKLLMWAEFMWRVQTHDRTEYLPGTTRMGRIPIQGMSEHFPTQEERSIEQLFTVGRPWLRRQLGDMAFGSLLHMIQDSFSGGHVQRRIKNDDSCGIPQIVRFHSYTGQDASAHKQSDKISRASDKISAGEAPVIDITKQLIQMREDREMNWPYVRTYLKNCVLRLAPDALMADTHVDH